MRQKSKTVYAAAFLVAVMAAWFFLIRLPTCPHPTVVTSVSLSQLPISEGIAALESWQIPDWVKRYNVSHLFDWTWHKNGDFHRCRTPAIQSTHSYACRAESTTIVNDALGYFRSHPDEGCIVDNVTCLPRPIPHPLPRARSLSDTCSSLNIDRKWIFCNKQQSNLDNWLSENRRFVTIAVFNAFVDTGHCHEDVPGTVFTEHATFHLQRWTDKRCGNDAISSIPKIEDKYRHTELIDSLGVYLQAPGHFGPQQLPRLLRLLATVPRTAKVLVAKGGVADAFIDVLIERGIVTRDRIVQYDKDIRPKHFANVVYRSESWPYLRGKDSSYYVHDRMDMQLVHRVMTGDVLLPSNKQDRIILIKREKGDDRSIIEHSDMAAFMAYALNKSKLSSKLQIEIFDARGHLRDHIALFRRARVIVGPHGAGMMNILWSSPGTHVVEVGYNTGMTLPEMYAVISLHLEQHYWICKGHGDYSAPIHVDMNDFIYIFSNIIRELETEDV
jgi:hypothetical protein